MSELRNFCQFCDGSLWKETSALFPELGLHCGLTQGRHMAVRRDGENEGFVVSWMLQGELRFEGGEGRYHMSEPCVCLRRPGHRYSMTYLRDVEHRRYYLRISEEAYRLLIQLHPTLDTVPPVRPLPYSEDLSRRFQALIYQLLRATKPQLVGLMDDMVSLIVDLAGIHAVAEEAPLARARRLLAQISGPRDLKDIALACDLSYSNFRKQFTRAYGISPGQYRIQCRIQEAKRALLEGCSIQAVADRLFYPDLYTFAHQFKRATGMPPGEYQRRHAAGREG